MAQLESHVSAVGPFCGVKVRLFYAYCIFQLHYITFYARGPTLQDLTAFRTHDFVVDDELHEEGDDDPHPSWYMRENGSGTEYSFLDGSGDRVEHSSRAASFCSVNWGSRYQPECI
jgi:hypothetical protein